MDPMIGTNSKVKTLQTVCILLVVFSLVGVLVRELAPRTSISTSPSQPLQQSDHTGKTATPDLHPNAQTP